MGLGRGDSQFRLSQVVVNEAAQVLDILQRQDLSVATPQHGAGQRLKQALALPVAERPG